MQMNRPPVQQQQQQYAIQRIVYVDDRGRVVRVEEKVVPISRR